MKTKPNGKLNTMENFINVVVDCQGYGETEAIKMAKNYSNDLVKYISDCRQDGDFDLSIEKCREFCGIN